MSKATGQTTVSAGKLAQCRLGFCSILMLITTFLAVSGCCCLFKICPPPTVTPVPGPGACATPSIDRDKSLVIHDPALLATPFNFRRTLQKIIDTSGGTTTSEALLQTLLDTYSQSSFTNPAVPVTIPVSPRPQEAAQSAAQLLDPTSAIGMVPVGLFNRFDLAPSDGSNCGEYRIVYARKPSFARFLMIFESKLPNPNPASGIAGCQPVVKFWADLTTKPDDASRIAALESFYYDGLPPFGSVVAHANYGIPFGQVRTNLFVEPLWMLRENRTWIDPFTGAPIFRADTVKESPLVELYRDPSGLPAGLTVAQQQGFRTDFLNQPICNLLLPDRANPAATEFDVVNGIGAGFLAAGDDFQSVSHPLPPPQSDDPTQATDPAMSTAITTRLGALGVTTVDSTQVLTRAGAMTCGGCHQFSVGQALNSAGHHWPSSLGFVHIDESGNLSDALLSFFLPLRKQIVERFVCDPTVETQPTAPCPALLASAHPLEAAMASAPAALPSAANLAPTLVARLRQGRTSPALVAVDDARLALLASAQRAHEAKPALKAAANRDVKQAMAALESEVQRARDAEAALPGAFTRVRRTH